MRPVKDSGYVHQHVDGTQPLRRSVDCGPHLALTRDVSFPVAGVATGIGDRPERRRSTLIVHVNHRHPCAFRRNADRRCAADARGPAGYQNPLAL